jgi:hypothetical protein
MIPRFALLITLFVLVPAGAEADDSSKTAAAQTRFLEGRELMANGKHAEACAKFDASYELEPRLGALLNRAACREKLGQTTTAWVLYHEAIGLARRENDPKRETFARDRAAALDSALRYLTISVPEDARLDGLAITRNTTPIEPSLWNQRTPVDPGDHEVRAEAPGFAAHTVRIRVADQDVEIKIRRLVARPGAPEVRPEPDVPGDLGMPKGRKLALASGAVAAAGLINGGLFALRSRSKASAAKELCTADFQCTAEGVVLVDDARTAANVAYVSYGVGLVAVAAAVGLWFTSSPRSGPANRDESARVTPLLHSGLIGLDIEVRF